MATKNKLLTQFLMSLAKLKLYPRENDHLNRFRIKYCEVDHKIVMVELRFTLNRLNLNMTSDWDKHDLFVKKYGPGA